MTRFGTQRYAWSGNKMEFDLNGSAGRTRTYNPSVNSRMLCH